MSGKNQVLQICLIGLLAIIGLYALITAQSGHYSDKILPNEGDEKPGRQLINEQSESDVLQTVSTVLHQEPNQTGNLVEQPSETGIEQSPEQTEKPTFLLPTIAKQNEPIALIAVGEKDTWLLAVASPVAAKIRQLDKMPILLVFGPEPVREQTRLLEKLGPLLGSCTILTSDPNLFLSRNQGSFVTNVVPTTSEPSETGLLVAKYFWQETDSVVVASIDDSAAAVLGAALASHLGVPFIPVTGQENPNVLLEELKALNIGRILFAISDASYIPWLHSFPAQETEILDMSSIQKQLVEVIGGVNVRNIILFRVANKFTGEGASSWLAPYLSLMRGAPVISCYSPDPLAAEENAEFLIRTYSLKPRTATILADYDSIGMIESAESGESEDYVIMVEPCSGTAEGEAAKMGVGRIPFRELWAASTLIARGIARSYILNQKEPKLLMIANPNTDYGSLPLCETISRATAKEFKNLRIHTDEFYGVSCQDQQIRQAAGRSQLIIFEGHITDFTLFEAPPTFSDEQCIYYSEWEDNQREDFIEVTHYTNNQPDDLVDQNSTEDESIGVDVGARLEEERVSSHGRMTETSSQVFAEQAEQRMEPCQLDGLPLMILQSCHSLDESAMEVLKSGAAGMVGSVTNVHSASGSAFIKAFCDGLLYRGDTIGEALRDARNYLLCVSALKTKRGHSQQAKVTRVAYSFHLWGDPELMLFAGLPRRAKLHTASAGFVGPDKIGLGIPEKRLPTSRTEKYFLRMFPGNEVAGIVKRFKNKDIRRVMPIYFFRVPVPEGFAPLRYTDLREVDDINARAVFLADSFERFLYILYLPERDQKGSRYILQFVE